jgi:indole-3-glycerol phosphate synthase
MAGQLEGTYLDRIVGWHRERAAKDDRELTALEKAARDPRLFPPRPFLNALTATQATAVIAEVKRRSPSKGELDPGLDPRALARSYEQGGASCLSVLTDAEHFGGSPEDLRAAREAVALPVLRKDFTVSSRDVFDARVMGADALLLIVAALGESELFSLLQLATELEMAALVEVHDQGELDRALSVGARLIGVNQRDLRTFSVDTERALALRQLMPPGVVSVAESGLEDPAQVTELARAGYDAVLVGEQFVRSGDPSGVVSSFVAAGRAAVSSCG